MKMRLSTVVVTAALAVGALHGQTKPEEMAAEKKAAEKKAATAVAQSAFEAEIIPVKTLTGDSFNRLLRMLSVFDARMTGDDQLRTIIVYAPKKVVAQMRQVVAELDRPGSDAAIGRNVEMTLTFLRCSTKAPASTASLGEMESVAKQLRATTQYKDIQVWDMVPLRLQEGKETTMNWRLPSLGTSATAAIPQGNITVRPDSVMRKGQGWSVRFSRLRFNVQIPAYSSIPYQNVGLDTAGDFLEGQLTVLGKVSGAEDDTAVFVVVALKVIE